MTTTHPQLRRVQVTEAQSAPSLARSTQRELDSLYALAAMGADKAS